MKKIFALVLFLGVACFANAQFFTFGLKAGLNTTSKVFNTGGLISGSNGNFIVVDSKTKVGFQAGAFARLKVLGVFIQPELYFSQMKNDVMLQEVVEDAVVMHTKSNSFNSLNIPVLIGYKVGPLRLNAGPVATIFVGGKSTVESITGIDMKAASWGFQAGLGVDILKMISIDARYEGNFSKLGAKYNAMTGSSVNFESRPQQFMVAVGIFLF